MAVNVDKTADAGAMSELEGDYSGGPVQAGDATPSNASLHVAADPNGPAHRSVRNLQPTSHESLSHTTRHRPPYHHDQP
jgi:hypothetical protein